MDLFYSGFMNQHRVQTYSHEEDVVDILNFFILMKQCEAHISRQPMRDRGETGVEFIYKILFGLPERCYDLFEMEKHVFCSLC